MMEKRSYNRFNQEQKAAITYNMEKNCGLLLEPEAARRERFDLQRPFT